MAPICDVPVRDLDVGRMKAQEARLPIGVGTVLLQATGVSGAGVGLRGQWLGSFRVACTRLAFRMRGWPNPTEATRLPSGRGSAASMALPPTRSCAHGPGTARRHGGLRGDQSVGYTRPTPQPGGDPGIALTLRAVGPRLRGRQ